MEDELIVLFSQTAIVISLCALLVEGVLIYIIYNNLRQTKQQFIDLNRPWLHLRIELIKETVNSGGGYNSTYTHYFPLILENSGHLTASNIKITHRTYLDTNHHTPDSKLFNAQEFYPSQTKTLLSSVSGVSKEKSDIIHYALSYEFSKEKIVKNYYLSQYPNSEPTLTDIEPGYLQTL